MKEKLYLKVVSPLKVLFEGEVEQVCLPGTDGPFTILRRHAPIVASLDPGVLTYRAGGIQGRIEVPKGGFVEKTGGNILVCVC